MKDQEGKCMSKPVTLTDSRFGNGAEHGNLCVHLYYFWAGIATDALNVYPGFCRKDRM